MVADPNIDIVDICTPSAYHVPLVPTPSEIEAIIAAKNASGKQIMTTSQDPQVRRYLAKR